MSDSKSPEGSIDPQSLIAESVGSLGRILGAFEQDLSDFDEDARDAALARPSEQDNDRPPMTPIES